MANSAVSYEYLKSNLDFFQQQINNIVLNITVSEVITIPSLSPVLSGLNTSVISIGPQFNFFGTGRLDHQQSFVNGTTYYMLTQDVAGQPSQFDPLDYYLGDPAVTTMWITSGSNAYSMPLYFDSTGIYFRPTTQISNIQSGSTFSFTMLLILAPAVSIKS